MLTIKKELQIAPAFDFSLIGEKETLLFFDIETTGLSAYQAGLYLIGCVSYENGAWILTQFFAESVADEIPMLNCFFALLADKQVLVSFNGDGFDIPFLKIMLQQYGLKHSFDAVQSYDIYKYIKPYRRLLGMPNCRLKSCERFLGIEREDIYSGGELIYVYYDYLKTKDESKLAMLLLHNAEDLENLPLVLPIVNYHYMLKGNADLVSSEIVTLQADAQNFCRDGEDLPAPGTPLKVMDLLYRSAVSVPVPVDIEQSRFTLNLSGDRLNLCVRLLEGELKYFYPDYKNYYYLTVEDCAVHKSVAEFVEPQFRCKATAKNCYTKKAGLYLPMLKPVFSPVFYKEYKGKVAYAACSDQLFADATRAQAYLKSFLEKL